MNEEEIRRKWEEMCSAVRDEMGAYAYRFATPLSLTEDLQFGQALGTGNYIELNQATYLMTNDHVVTEALGGHLAHLPGPTDDYVGCGNPIMGTGWPYDVALMRLEASLSGHRGALKPSCFDRCFRPVEHELMFWLGYPGSTAERHEPITSKNIRHTWFGHLHTPAYPILVQEAPVTRVIPKFDPRAHVVLHYPSRAQRSAHGGLESLPNPKGMSGSLLWDTKFLACAAAGTEWSPEAARVCGLVWAAHGEPEIVVATKIEHVRPWLLFFLRQECAYFRWLRRGRPDNDALADWVWAEQQVPDLM